MLTFKATPTLATFTLVKGGKYQAEFDGELTWKVREPVVLRDGDEFDPAEYEAADADFLENFADNFTAGDA